MQKHIRKWIDLLQFTVQSASMIENYSANRVLAYIMLFGLGAFNHVRYTYVVFCAQKAHGTDCLSLFFSLISALFSFISVIWRYVRVCQ